MDLQDLKNLLCIPPKKDPVVAFCENHPKTRAYYDGHTYRCPFCRTDVGGVTYDKLHFSFPEVLWKDVVSDPDEPVDAMTWVGCSPEASKEITESLRRNSSDEKEA